MTMTRASSFHGYPGGDTQPMESQVYRDYNESVVKSTTTTPKKTVLRMEVSPDGKILTYDTAGDTAGTDKTPHSYVEGDTGFVDLENAWQEASPTAQSISSNMEDLLESPEAQIPSDIAMPRPAMPQTPSVAGHKRNHSGEILTSEHTTKSAPAFSQLFGGGQKGTILSNTQLFNQTQAPSSPLPDGPRSDPVMTRPSPNLHNEIRTTSPTVIVSSPVATMHSRPPATAGEPRDTYTCMRESQERRAGGLRRELGLFRDIDDDILEEDEEEEEEDEEDIEIRRFENERMRRVMSNQALQQWSRVRAPSRLSSPPTSSPKQLETAGRLATIDLVTPGTMRKGQRIEFDVSDDGHETEDEEVVGIERPEDVELTDDEYDELGQTVLRSQANDQEVEPEKDFRNGDEDGEGGKDDDEGLHQSPLPPSRGVQQVTQHSAVADSQPELEGNSRPWLHAHTNGQSSMSSFVPGSQYVGRSSQDQALLQPKASNGVRQLQPSSTDQGQIARVPSSPPLDAVTNSLPGNDTHASAARQRMLAAFQASAKHSDRARDSRERFA